MSWGVNKFAGIMLVVFSVTCFAGLTIGSVTARNEIPSSLIQDVSDCPYNVSDYDIHVFDCSNMAAQMYDHLTEKGYYVKVVIFDNETTDNQHVSLKVNGHFVEPTHKRVDSGDYSGYNDSLTRTYRTYKNIQSISNKEWIYKNQGEVIKDYIEELGKHFRFISRMKPLTQISGQEAE